MPTEKNDGHQLIVPVPDPTTLTTDQLRREIAAVQGLVETRLISLRELLSTEISKLKAVNDEVFARIDVQFIERDKRTEQLALASSTAIAAALQAAKEAVGAQNTSNSIAIAKSESSTLESLRQLRELFLSESKATNDKVDDLKSRLDKGEAGIIGAHESRTEMRLSSGHVLTAISVAFVGLTVLLAAAALVFHHP